MVKADDILKDERMIDDVAKIDLGGVGVEIKQGIGVVDMFRFCLDVRSLCVDMKAGDYFLELLEPGKREAMYRYFTNIELPEDDIRKYEFLMEEHIYQVVREHMPPAVDMLCNICDEYVRNDIRAMMNAELSEVITLIRKMDEMMSVGESMIADIDKNTTDKLMKLLTEK